MPNTFHLQRRKKYDWKNIRRSGRSAISSDGKTMTTDGHGYWMLMEMR